MDYLRDEDFESIADEFLQHLEGQNLSSLVHLQGTRGAMPLDNRARWAATELRPNTALADGPLTREQLKEQLDCGCYATHQLLSSRLAFDEVGQGPAQILEAYWNCWRSNFEK